MTNRREEKYDGEILSLIDKFLVDAEKNVKHLPDDLTAARKQVIDFQSDISDFLDYVFTNYPTGENRTLDNKYYYFPRPKYRQLANDYIENFKQKRKNKLPTEELLQFLMNSFTVIKNNSFAISLIESAAKHEKPHRIDPLTKVEVDYSDDELPPGFLKYLDDGTLIVGDSIIVGVGSKNNSFTNLSINGTHIKSLHIFHVGNGQRITFNQNDFEISLNYIDWAKNCFTTCKSIRKLIS